MFDVIGDTAATSTTLMVSTVASLFLGAHLWSPHRYRAAVMRAAGLLVALTGLIFAIHGHGWVTRLDAATTNWFVAHRSSRLDVVAVVITDLGSPVCVAAASVVSATLLSWLARSIVPGTVILGVVSAAALTETVIKALIDRPRPAPGLQLVLETDASFPSGHVTATAALLGIVAVYVGASRGRTGRFWLMSGAVIGVLIIAATRVYLGVHWLTDVTGAAIIASAYVVVGATALSALGARHQVGGTLSADVVPAEEATDDVARRNDAAGCSPGALAEVERPEETPTDAFR